MANTDKNVACQNVKNTVVSFPISYLEKEEKERNR
jgi:hypothetical protein